MSKKLMLYGANGYTSRLIIKELVGQNIKQILEWFRILEKKLNNNQKQIAKNLIKGEV